MGWPEKCVRCVAMPLPAVKGSSTVALGFPEVSLLRVTAVLMALCREEPPQPDICMWFSVPGNCTHAPTSQPHSPFLRGFAILSFFSRSTQTVKETGEGLGFHMTVKGCMATSSLS